MPKVIITGTAGFIGMHTATRLADAGYEVTGIDNINDYYDVRLKYARLEKLGFPISDIRYGERIFTETGNSFIQLNLEHREGMMKLFEEVKADYVINLAAQAGVRYSLINPYTYIDSNITGFLNILEACRANPVRHLVYASSSSVYGLNKNIPFNESGAADHPVSLYAASKKANEMMAHTYAHLFQIPSSGLRFFTVYGPWGRPDMALFIFTKNILEDKPIEVFNEGKMTRDFTYIDDIVSGVVGLMENPPTSNPNFDSQQPISSISSAPYAIYNIGNNSPVDLMEFIRAIEKKLDKKAEIIYKPLQPGDVTTTYADASFLEKTIGYKPDTKVDVGISRFIDWFRKYYGI
jgi:UDP-glucuronate 4-epimerase